MKTSTWILILLGTVSLLAAPAAVRAQVPAGEEVARQQLLERAQASHQSGAHREALDQAQRAARIRKTPTLLLFIAQEQEEIGALADAYASAQQCAREAELDPQAKLREAAIDRCRSLAERLKGRVSYIVVNAPNPPQGFSVSLSGQRLNTAAIGLPYVMTPGRVSVEAAAPGHVPYRLEIDVPEGKTINVTVSLAPQTGPAACPADQHLDGKGRCVGDACRIGMVPVGDGVNCCWPGQSWDPASGGCSGVPSCPTGTEPNGTTCVPVAVSATAPGPEQPPGGTPFGSRFKPAALVLAAAGAAALVTGGILWLVANGRFGDLKDACNNDPGCTVDERREMIDGVKRMDNWALGVALGGAALVGSAAVLQWAFPRTDERRTQLGIDPVTHTLVVGGQF